MKTLLYILAIMAMTSCADRPSPDAPINRQTYMSDLDYFDREGMFEHRNIQALRNVMSREENEVFSRKQNSTYRELLYNVALVHSDLDKAVSRYEADSARAVRRGEVFREKRPKSPFDYE